MTSIEASHDEDDRAIRELEREYDVAWNRSDVAHLASLYCRDAIVVNPLGEVARGQPAIRAALEAFFQGAARGSRHYTRISTISHVDDRVAVVDGEARLEGIRGISSESAVSHVFTDIVLRDGTRWLLAHTRAYVFATFPSSTA